MNILRDEIVVPENDHILIDAVDIRHEERQAWIAGFKKEVFTTKTISSIGRATTAANSNVNNNGSIWVHSIYRIPACIREVNPAAYEPQAISLGPYNCHKPHLQATNALKWCYLARFLRRNPEKNLENYVELVEELESQVRGAYSQLDPSFSSEKFAQMMVLDCCFVLEYLLLNDRNCERKGGDVDEELFSLNNNFAWAMPFLMRDMLLLENQLPFFLLKKLLEFNTPQENLSLPGIVCDVFWDTMPGMIYRGAIDMSSDGSVPIHHILHLMHSCAIPMPGMMHNLNVSSRASLSCLVKMRAIVFGGCLETASAILGDRRCSMFIDGAKMFLRYIKNGHLDNDYACSVTLEGPTLLWIPSVMKLREVGVVFKRKRNHASFLDITFDRGVMEIPPLKINSHVDAILHNLITFEQCHKTTNDELSFYFSSYVYLMKFMVDTVADVQMLRGEGILFSNLDSDDDVVNLFKKLHKNTTFDTHSYLSCIFEGIQIHCNKRTSRWKAALNQNWEIISVAAATFLFVLSIIQTVLAFFTYLRPISPN